MDAATFASVESLLAQFLELKRQEAKQWYTVNECAESLGKRPYTVREWCREGRVNGTKRDSGRGCHKDWMIHRDEIERYRNFGLLPVASMARH